MSNIEMCLRGFGLAGLLFVALALLIWPSSKPGQSGRTPPPTNPPRKS